MRRYIVATVALLALGACAQTYTPQQRTAVEVAVACDSLSNVVSRVQDARDAGQLSPPEQELLKQTVDGEVTRCANGDYRDLTAFFNDVATRTSQLTTLLASKGA